MNLKSLLFYAAYAVCYFVGVLAEFSYESCSFVESGYDEYFYSQLITAENDVSHNSQYLKRLFCLAGSAKYQHMSLFKITQYFYENKCYINSIIYAYKCIENVPINNICWRLLTDSYYQLKIYDRSYFYHLYVDTLFGDYEKDQVPSKKYLEGMFNNKLTKQQQNYLTKLHDKYQTTYSATGDSSIQSLHLFYDIYDTELFLRNISTIYSKSDEPFQCSTLYSSLQQTSPPAYHYNFLKNDISQNSHFYNKQLPIKIYSNNNLEFSIPYTETINSLYQTLSALHIPCKIVTYINNDSSSDDAHNEDLSLYIFIHMTPFSGILHQLPRYYIIYNLEPHPSVIDVPYSSSSSEASIEENAIKLKFGLIENKTCGYNMIYPSFAVKGALAIWDSREVNLPSWNQYIGLKNKKTPSIHYVPLLGDLHKILQTCVSQYIFPSFNAVHDDLDAFLSCSEEGKEAQPIDILFYGTMNAHRRVLFNILVKVAKSKNWVIRTFTNYELYGDAKNTIIDQSKVCLL